MSLAASKENASSASAIQHQSVLRSEAVTTLESPQLELGKRKAEQFSRSDCPSELASRHPALGHLSVTCQQPKDPRVNL